ncbi:15292_t:CDS:2 [Entrophospora sp. SA101]|nr:15292_t:CDS:2 [Entrophospora sp. SA101]
MDNKIQEKPIPTLSDHTIPSSKWIILMPSSNISGLLIKLKKK